MAEEMVDALVVETVGAELSEDDERALRLQEIVEQRLWQAAVVGSGRVAANDTLLRQLLHVELEQGLGQRHVDVYARVMVGRGLDECLIA